MNKRIDAIPIRRRQRVQAYSSAAKMKATDLAMTNANLGLEIAGAAGLEQSSGMEKIFRDAKLLQIYEGTNQMNRKHIFDSIIARNTTL
jgi:alkylation response protein AidB-like acyl-CoA dehydrogenase